MISEGRGKYIIALRTSPVGIIPSFSPFFFSENREKASRISFSSAPVMLCSFASLDCRTLGVLASPAAARRLGGYYFVRGRTVGGDFILPYHFIAQSLCERILLRCWLLGIDDAHARLRWGKYRVVGALCGGAERTLKFGRLGFKRIFVRLDFFFFYNHTIEFTHDAIECTTPLFN